ncbi:ACP S-malonyltransferase [Lamprobacter modestohalophilus]|uniref:Malonyl CoA-acyl carrier protein transacylase n=1 Tax=Lamprobacter modestohalophilus TaxID=1064514 RepID=A0A9X1B3Q6_9GAMM|nr:ACP S-malonyltransferase [Lamprobacter modestohalophilus]MBK1617852.1 [acyl-carrier-protein] S-malonyltransferase [Lamprobacter modestohalophilus]MEA1049746.1 ACP S-malonyltransferase [Lamprobacter modestohalophilus]
MTSHPAFFFPGQGSQAIGMLAELAAAFPLVKATFDEASQILSRDLWALSQDGPKDELDQTVNTQPAMLAAGVAVWRVWREQGGAMPSVMAGHSLGEYSALSCAGALTFADAVSLVAERARLMQAAVPGDAGAMAALLGLDDDAVAALCRSQAEGQVLEPVNFNAPGQVVIAGEREAVQRAVDASKAAGAKRAVLLPVSVPSHCALMREAAAELAAQLDQVELHLPSIPVIHNVTVDTAESPALIRQRLAEQLFSPVRWVESVRTVADSGVQLAIEAGPGKVLTGLGKRIDKRLTTLPVFDPEGLSHALEVCADV